MRDSLHLCALLLAIAACVRVHCCSPSVWQHLAAKKCSSLSTSGAFGMDALSCCFLPTGPACRYNIMTKNWHKGFRSCCASFLAPTAKFSRLPELFFQDVSVLALYFRVDLCCAQSKNSCTQGVCVFRLLLPPASAAP